MVSLSWPFAVAFRRASSLLSQHWLREGLQHTLPRSEEEGKSARQKNSKGRKTAQKPKHHKQSWHEEV
jgi:hypothetical protein